MKTKNKTLIIAEIGVNHNGSIEIAKQLIDVSKRAGADIVKFQTFNAKRITTNYASTSSYQFKNTKKENQFNLLESLELSKEMHRTLLQYCDSKKIEFLSTGFDLISLKYLVELGIKRIKIPSGELTNLPYLEKIPSFKLPVILSTGMSYLKEVKEALQILIDSGQNRQDITVMHCTSSYPAIGESLNLKSIKSIEDSFGVITGYSDHSLGNEAGLIAVALGAKMIEKHITLDKNLEGPDHKASMDPDEFVEYTSLIRKAEIMLGDGIKKPYKNELENRKLARKSIVAQLEIKKGQVFDINNLAVKRPDLGISPMYWHKIIGQKATKNYQIDEIINEFYEK